MVVMRFHTPEWNIRVPVDEQFTVEGEVAGAK